MPIFTPSHKYSAVLVLGTVLAYHMLYHFVEPMLYRSKDIEDFEHKHVTSIRQRGPGKRSSGDEIWTQLRGAPELQWYPCYNGFQCARLEVPLDYWNSTTDGIVTLAITMLPAKVSISDPRYGGPILVNTGGPGVASTTFTVNTGPSIQSQVDTPTTPAGAAAGNVSAQYYDIVGIDPRGVGFSQPIASCFETDTQRAEWNLRTAAIGLLGSSDTAVADVWGQWRAYGLACDNFLQTMNTSSNIFPFMTTASTARDMITFIDAYSEWREARKNHMLTRRVDKRIYESNERVNYIGYSWGTFLGMSFASMFPNRTGRLVLDAVVDTDDYMHALWTVSVFDSEKTVSWFYSSCAEAGSDLCALAKPNSTAEDIRTRVESILSYLYQHPVASTGTIPNLLTWSDVMSVRMVDTYSPKLWSDLAAYLTALENATSSSVAKAAAAANYPVPGNIPAEFLSVAAEAGIACGDAFPEDPTNFTLADAQAHWDYLHGISPTMAATFAPLRYMCAAWRNRALYAYRGPFGSMADSGMPPPLFVANTADPVTPIRNARKMVQRFNGARLLTLDMPGHSSLALASTCREEVVRAYVQRGEMPEDGFVCQPSERPFYG